jgi:hypothetical protein
MTRQLDNSFFSFVYNISDGALGVQSAGGLVGVFVGFWINRLSASTGFLGLGLVRSGLL